MYDIDANVHLQPAGQLEVLGPATYFFVPPAGAHPKALVCDAGWSLSCDCRNSLRLCASSKVAAGRGCVRVTDCHQPHFTCVSAWSCTHEIINLPDGLTFSSHDEEVPATYRTPGSQGTEWMSAKPQRYLRCSLQPSKSRDWNELDVS